MKAFVLAAGLGTRLKPWTLSHPKALVPVGGVPMLKRVIERLCDEGFDYIVVNVHHFSEQIIEFLNAQSWRAHIEISDESDCLLDTGAALVKAAPLLCMDDEPFLIHNVDILSDAPLASLMHVHADSGAQATLLVSERASSRALLFDSLMHLRGWKNLSTGEHKGESGDWPVQLAFSGIHAMSPSLIDRMLTEELPHVFPIMDFYLKHTADINIRGLQQPGLNILDIGKPETLSRANNLFL